MKKDLFPDIVLNHDTHYEAAHSDDSDDDQHFSSALDYTPMTKDAFALSDQDKIAKIESHFAEIMRIMGLDLSDDSLQGTPKRVAKMFVNEIFAGLNPDNKPQPTLFANKYRYKQMILEKNIPIKSTCEHHFQPIVGVAHVAYISADKVIGLSKLNRIVDYYARRPQVQERLTTQIANELKEILETEDVAVYIDARHFCVSQRGIMHDGCSTVTYCFSGQFETNASLHQDFMNAIAIQLR